MRSTLDLTDTSHVIGGGSLSPSLPEQTHLTSLCSSGKGLATIPQIEKKQGKCKQHDPFMASSSDIGHHFQKPREPSIVWIDLWFSAQAHLHEE